MMIDRARDGKRKLPLESEFAPLLLTFGRPIAIRSSARSETREAYDASRN